MIIFVTLVAISLQPDLLEATEKNLASHMILEHALFFFLGAISVQVTEIFLKLIVSIENTNKRNAKLLSYSRAKESKSNFTSKIIISFWSQLLRKIFSVNSRYSFVWLVIPIVVLTFWHIPSIFDYATLNEPVHILQHISFIIVGATAFLALRTLGESFKILILITLNAIMAFAGLMFAVTTTPVYPIYSVSSHNDAGTYMLVTCILLLLGVLPAYLIHRAIFHLRIKRVSDDHTWQQGLK
jgi:hypothetical protein